MIFNMDFDNVPVRYLLVANIVVVLLFILLSYMWRCRCDRLGGGGCPRRCGYGY